MRVGLVCPYAWDVPGGVQGHVRDLAAALLRLGHEVSVLTPADDPTTADLPSHVVPAGRTVPVPYNGSVARLAFGPLALARTRRWLRTGGFDVLHLHEPTVPSLPMLACFAATGPMVATFHTATARSRALQVFGTALQPGLEKITGRIAVSPAARQVVVEHLGGDAVLVPNGVDVARFAGARPLPGRSPGSTVVFLGRIDEPRKGLSVLLAALPALARARPDVRLLIAGPGDRSVLRVPAGHEHRVQWLGQVPEADKPAVYASGAVYCAPNTHGESFGMVLTEAMSAGAAVVASDLEAFRHVLSASSGAGSAGVLTPVGDAEALAAALAGLLADPARQARLVARGRLVVQAFDWTTVTRSVVQVYETVASAAPASIPPARVSLDQNALAQEPDVVPAAALGERPGELAEDDPHWLSGTLRRWLLTVTGRVAP